MEKPLRRGWTTGACAAAAAKAAYHALLSGVFPDPVAVTLPRGLRPAFPLSQARLGADGATAGVIKDAGDDPDVTHGAEIVATVAPGPRGSGVGFRAGGGVGTITLPGLALAVGEPAINPAPRSIIAANLAEVAAAHGATADLVVSIAIPGGAELATRTMNPRLGIVGGLSVLGTTGVVMPYSCSAWIASIHRGVDVALALGLGHLAGATGKTSEAAVQQLHGLPEAALLDMGGFVGALLKYLRRRPVGRLTIAGGFAKMAKLAGGALDLHSGATRLDRDRLADLLGGLGADAATMAAARQANTAAAILALAGDRPLAELIARQARETALAALAGGTALDVAVFDRSGRLIAHAGG